MRLYFFRIIQGLLLLTLCSPAFSQVEPMLGPTSVQPGSTTLYSMNWYQAPDNWDNITWLATGGTIVYQDAYTCEVQWGEAGAGHVSASEDEWGQSGALDIQIGTPQVTVSPTPLSLDYGGAQQYLYATPSNNYPVTQILWQYSPNGSSGWTTITAATNFDAYGPSTTISQYYRCIVTENGGQYYSNVVQVIFNPLSPGTIAMTQQPGYNSVPTITNTPSHGGLCLPGDRTYAWEQSIDGQPWVTIGTSVNYPSTNVVIGNTFIRRKVTCNGVTQISNVINVTPTYSSVDFENLNYIRTIDVHLSGINTWQQADQLAIDSKSQSTTYLDGLGRSIQKVAKGVSYYNNAWTDLVQPLVYDGDGRSIQAYLAYPSTDNPGKFKSTNVLAQQASFVTTKFGEPSGAPTYSGIVYDNSPLNRVKTVYAPGQSWGGSSTGVKNDIDFNNSTENVHVWALAYGATAIPATSPTAVYGTGVLSKSITTEEKGKQVISYADLSGNIILKKVQEKEAGSGLTGQHDGWACTYYVYDDLNQLRFTISPKAVAYLDANGWGLTQQLVDDLCFVYSYDARGRVVSKKQPGMGQADIVYDQQDRPVFLQDGNGKGTQLWQGTVYDVLGRVTATGVLPQNITTAALQTYINQHSGAATIITTNTNLGSTGGVADLVVNSRQAGVIEYVATNSITFTSGFTSEAGAQFTAYINGNRIASTNEIVTIQDNTAYAGFLPLTQQYYDDYGQKGAGKSYTVAENTLKDPATSPLAINIPAQPSPQTRGLVTVSKVKVLTTPSDLTQGTWLETDNYFNDAGFIIQTQKDNLLSGTDVITNWIDFTGKAWGDCVKHRAGTANQFTIVSRSVYDRLGKLADLYKNFNGTISKHLVTYGYDEYGRLKTKVLAPEYTGTGGSSLETLDYTYNIQGWLTGINKGYATSLIPGDQWTHYFGLYLGYDNRDNQFSLQQLNGNITGVIWKSQGDNAMRKYDYTYDNLGRLTSALFHQRKIPSDPWLNNAMDLSEYIGYADGNGNIQTMKHLGAVPGMAAGTVVDDLLYTYGSTANPNVNKLSRVDERATLTGNGQLYDFKDGTNAAGTFDYTYDNNGNLVEDENKGIANGGVTYNHLNKAQKITIAGKSMIEYIYDATGTKMSKKVTNLSVTPNTVSTTQYSDGFVYQDGNIQYVLHEEGRMKIITALTSGPVTLNAGPSGANNVLSGKQGVFEYFMKDQLGNTRMVLTEEVQSEAYTATMELTSGSDPNLGVNEAKVFGKVDPATGNPATDNELVQTRVDRSSTPWSGNASGKVTELTASLPTKKVGPNLILKVSAGDVINATSKYFYFTNDATGTTNPVNDALSSLMGALLGNKASAITKANSSLIQTNLSAAGGDFANFVNGHGSVGPASAPKAFLNVVFFDEQFNFIAPDPTPSSVGTAVERVSQANTQSAQLAPLSQKAPKNGWVFIYLSNESNQSVYFDDFQVSQVHGRISEENHYYAFGQKIAGICTRAFNKLNNPFSYQAEYSEEETNTGWNEFDQRAYDPQLGRWTGADPHDQYASPYIGMGNDPVNTVDPDGGGTADLLSSIGGALAGGVLTYAIARNNGASVWAALGYAAGGGLVGASLGYGIAAGLESNISPWLHIRAFYEGFFNFGGGVVNSAPDAMDNATYAIAPRVWDWVSKVHINFNFGRKIVNSISNTVEENFPTLSRSVVGQLAKVDKEIEDIKTPDPTPLVARYTIQRLVSIPFNAGPFTMNVAMVPWTGGISEDQNALTNTIVTRVNAQVRAARGTLQVNNIAISFQAPDNFNWDGPPVTGGAELTGPNGLTVGPDSRFPDIGNRPIVNNQTGRTNLNIQGNTIGTRLSSALGGGAVNVQAGSGPYQTSVNIRGRLWRTVTRQITVTIPRSVSPIK